jgi:hypothetical protein
MTPDQIGSQYGFVAWCLVALASSMGGAMVWYAKAVIIPDRDRHYAHLDRQEKFMDALEAHNRNEEKCLESIVVTSAEQKRMHEENKHTLQEIKSKIRCPTVGTHPIAGTVG